MRVGFPGGPRLEWYDRNPIVVLQQFGTLVGPPHVQTERWTYTVPTGKKAFIESLMLHVLRAAAATTVGLVTLYIWIRASGGTDTIMYQANLRTNNVGDRDRGDVGQGGVLQTADRVRATSQDSSTGGSIDYLATIKATEFDA